MSRAEASEEVRLRDYMHKKEHEPESEQELDMDFEQPHEKDITTLADPGPPPSARVGTAPSRSHPVSIVVPSLLTALLVAHRKSTHRRRATPPEHTIPHVVFDYCSIKVDGGSENLGALGARHAFAQERTCPCTWSGGDVGGLEATGPRPGCTEERQQASLDECARGGPTSL